jgi:hypothetical protein
MVAEPPLALLNSDLLISTVLERANMKNMSLAANVYIISTILIGLGLIAWMFLGLDLANPGLLLLAILGAVAQTLKVEGPNDKTNYNIAWFVYGFAFFLYGPATAIFVIVIAHLGEWIWHKYPWYIQSFNIGAHTIPVFVAGLVYRMISSESKTFDLTDAIGMVVASLVFVLVNHFLVGAVVKLARGQDFAESGVFEFFTLFLDFTVLSMGAVTALVWLYNPFASLLNILPLYLLYNALRVPALERQLAKVKSKP